MLSPNCPQVVSKVVSKLSLNCPQHCPKVVPQVVLNVVVEISPEFGRQSASLGFLERVGRVTGVSWWVACFGQDATTQAQDVFVFHVCISNFVFL